MFIKLEKAHRLAEGNRRWVYVHPENPDLLIKVVKPTARLKYRYFKRLRRRYMHTAPILRELREQIVVRLDDPYPPRFLPKVAGFVDTDLGLGLVVRAERGADGDYAPTLKTLIKQGKITPKLLEDIRKFFAEVRASNAVTGDLTIANIVMPTRKKRASASS